MSAVNRGGRPRKQLDVQHVTTSYAAGQSIAALARDLGVDRGTVRRHLEEASVQLRDDRGAHWANKRAGGGAPA